VRGALLLWMLVSGLWASAQHITTAPWDSPFLLRLQRGSLDSRSCVLLRRDGGYHLEREHGDSTAVFEGALPQEQLAQVTGWLNDNGLQKLTQADIPSPLISGVDHTQINIFRWDHWQTLTFPSRESRLVAAPSLEPLLAWLGALHKLPARKLSEEEGRNNCLLPREIALKQRPAPDVGTTTHADAAPPAAAAAEPAAVQVNYLMRFESFRYEGASAERTCLIVYPNGKYHGEKLAQRIGRSMTSWVYEDSLDAAAIAKLRQLIDDPAIENARSNLPAESHAEEGTGWFIPRAGGTQRLNLAANFVWREGNYWHSVANDPGPKVVKPLEGWIKANFHPTQHNSLKDAKSDGCAAQ
jgi:hypothetical protein